MFGGGYLSCQESKSGNIKRLLLRFVVEKVNGKICVSCLLADTEKRSEVVWLVTNGHVSQGVLRWERGHSLTLTPDERLLSLHVVPWSGLDIGIKLKLMMKTGQYLNKIQVLILVAGRCCVLV